MYVCPNCGKTFNAPTNFCDSCGGSVVYQGAPVQPLYSAPVSYQQPAPSKGKHIAGMVLGIIGMVTALIGMLYAMILFPEAVDRRYAAEALGIVGLIFAILSLPLSIVGLSLSNRKAFGVVGTILGGILFFLGIIFLAAAA